MDTVKIKTTGVILPTTVITINKRKYYPSHMFTPQNRKFFSNMDKGSRIEKNGMSYYALLK